MAVTEISPDLHTLCLRYAMPVGRGYGGDHLGAVAGNAFVFVLAAHPEAGDVLQEYQWNLALAAQLDEVRAFLRRFGKQDAVIRSEEHTSELTVTNAHLVCRLLIEKKNSTHHNMLAHYKTS